jgi:hypothetical protein
MAGETRPRSGGAGGDGRASASTIAGFENGERHMKLDMQLKLMAALQVSPQQFFSQPPRDPGVFDWSGLRGAVLRPLLRTGAWLFRIRL